MFSLPRVQINNDLDECSICKEPFNKPRANGIISETIGGLQEATSHANSPRFCIYHLKIENLPKEAVRLPCGHIFGSHCISTWISGWENGDPPSCPSCRALLPRVGQVTTLSFPLAAGNGTYCSFSEEANMETAISTLHEESDLEPVASVLSEESLTEPEI